MEPESPSFMEGNELIMFPSSKVVDEDEHVTWGKKLSNNNNTKNPKRRRLVITTMSEEPILIEIRPNLLEPMIHPLVCNSTQCDDVEKGCCKKNVCLEHMNLWNKLYQVIHNTNTINFCEESWFKKQDEVNGSLSLEKGMNCSELWPKISSQALDYIVHLKHEIRREKEERERYALALTKFSDLEEQLELEKTMRKQDCQKLEAKNLELHNQVISQAEEIRRLWTENLANESDDVNTKSDENKLEEDAALERKQSRILELEDRLTKELKQHKIILRDQEIQCDFFHLNNDELEKRQVVTLVENIEYDNLKLKIEELEMEKLQYQENITSSSIVNKDDSDHMLEYATLVRERDNLKEELETVNNNFNRTTSKLRDNVAKRRRLEAESEDEKQQRSNLAAALYELESEVEATISITNTLQSTALKSMAALTNDLQKFQEALEKRGNSNNIETKPSAQNDHEITKSLDCETNQCPIQTLEIISSNVFKGIPDTRSVIFKLTQGHENLLNEISNVRKAVKRALKSHKRRMHVAGKEMTNKLENIESEKETLRWKTKALDEENKSLEQENSKLQQEVSSLQHTKSKLTLQVKDLEKEMEDIQENLRNLRDENRRLLKEAKWKSVGKQGGYQESLIVQEWEKKLQKLEADYEILQHVKNDLVKEKHRLEDELDKAMEKGYRELGGREDQKLDEELFNMTQERNKLRKIKITLAIENVSLKESLALLRTQVDVLENECETVQEWKDKVRKLEEECEDLRDWKKKAEALEVECKDLCDNQMKVEAHESECKVKNSKPQEFGEKYQKLHKNIEAIDKKCGPICHSKDCFEEECKSLRACKVDLEKKCQILCQRANQLEKNQKTFCNKSKEKIEKYNKNNKLLDVDKSKINILECRIEDLSEDESKVEVEEGNKNLHQLSTSNIEHCNMHEYLEKIANLEQENKKLCQTHQAALDKQWDVLQADLKAFEAKIEDLENECESVRRDHLSSMVENAELVREKEKLLTLYNEQKYNYEILETANECLQKDQEQKEAERVKEQQSYCTSIDNLNKQVMELESTFSERLRQQTFNYELFSTPKININGQETITLSRQEYEILLAEKAVMLQERDSAHKKLCSAEVQNLQLSASIECLRQEVPCANQGYKEKENDAEVLLAQDVVNLRSMLSSQEEELEIAHCERNKLLEVNTSTREELNKLHEALSQCQHENQNLHIVLDELKRKSSLEQIHSAASSLKEQLGKASKEKDLIKEQLNKAIKEKEQLTTVANEKDKVIFSLKEKITKLEKEREGASSFNIQLQDVKDNAAILSHVKDQSMIVAKERDNAKEEVIILKHQLESLNKKMLVVNDDLIEKTKSWKKEQSDFKEKCRRLEVELMNTKEALDMIKKKMQDDLQEAIQEKADFELVAKKEVKNVLAQVFQLQDELFKTKQTFNQKLDLATKEMEYIVTEKNILVQEIIELKEKKVLVQKDKENLTIDIAKCNGHTQDSMLLGAIEDVNQSNVFIPKTFLEQGIQANFQEEELKPETKEINQSKHETTPTFKEQNDELIALIEERDFLMLSVSQLKMEKDTQSHHKDICSCNCNLIQVSNCEEKFGEKDQLTLARQLLMHEQNNLLAAIAKFETQKEMMLKKFEQDLHMEVSTIKALLATTTKEKEELAISEGSLHKKLNDMCVTMQLLNEQLESSSNEKDCLEHAKEVIILERDDLLERISTFETQQEKFAKLDIKGIQNENSSLMYEKITLLSDHENLIAEIVLLKKEKEDIEKKLDRIVEQNTTSLNDVKNSLAKTTHDLYAKHEQHANLIKENIQLKEENVFLVQTKDHFIHEHENLIIQLTLVKKDNEEIKEKLTKEMGQLTVLQNKLTEAISEKDQVVATEISLIQQLNLLQVKETNQEQNQTKLEKEINTLNQIIENIVEDRNNLIKQHDPLQNEYSSLLESKNDLRKECDTLFKELTILRSEKETLDKEFSANLLEKDQISASITTLKDEVGNLNKRVFTFNEQVTKLVEENEKLKTKLNAKISMNQEQQTCVFDTTELGILCNIEPANQLNEKLIEENRILNVDLESCNKQLEFFKQQQNELVQERDNVVELLKNNEQTYACTTNNKVEMEALKQKLILLEKKYDQLVLERNNVTQENEFLHQQCDTIFAEIFALTIESENKNTFEESIVTDCVVSKERFAMHQIKNLQKSMNILKEQQTNLMKDNKQISFENEALTKEKDSLIASISLLKKQHKVVLAQEFKKKGVTTLEVTLQKKFEELVESVNTLNKSQEGHITEKELMTHTIESFTKECDDLFATITALKNEQLGLCSSIEHQTHGKVDQSMVVKEKESTKLEALLREKLNEFANKIAILVEGFVASTKKRKQLILEMTSIKQECQKLQLALVVAERNKDTLMKSVIESRSISDCLTGEISRLQKKLTEVEMKLAHTTTDRNKANLQIADLQKLLNNNHRLHHLQRPYSAENFKTLEAQHRCLRMEKDVMEEHLRKNSRELEGNYQFQEQFPSMTDFRIHKMDSHPLPCPSFHTSSQLSLSGLDPLGRPQPPPPPMLHQQWPM